MVRQCAWCLCLINGEGERISPAPLPKLYEATHGICSTCGIQWMEQVMAADEAKAAKSWQHGENENGSVFPEVERQEQQEERRETITQLILQLQQDPTNIPADPWLKPAKKTHSL